MWRGMLCGVLALLMMPASVGCSAHATTSTVLRPQTDAAGSFRHAAVAADHPLASQAGAEILRQGGNAVDAAVATSFCLSVVRPYSCGIGGGGFMVIYRPGTESQSPRAVALNYRETSPAAVGRDYYVQRAEGGDDRASRFGHHASGVPGTVAGLLYALEHYGTLDRATVMEPAIRIAQNGWLADASHLSAAHSLGRALQDRPDLRQGAAYIWEQLCLSGAVEVGDRISNPQQARALRLIADQGAAAFYGGAIADAIAETMSDHQGTLTSSDLRNYRVVETTPLVGSFQGRAVLAMPPPSSGGIAILQILGLLERRLPDLDPTDFQADYVHLVAEAMKHAFADRAEFLADAAFVDVPIARLLSDVYLDELASRIDLARTQDRFVYGSVTPAPADSGTSHLSVIDAGGMAVACTETINMGYGSLVCVPGFGFALNNEMDDFTTIPGQPNAYGLRQSDRNLPEPGKRPLSSMSPTIVVGRDGRAELVAGASGGPRIITGTLQCLLNCLLFDMPPAEGVGQPRFHHQWMPETLLFEGRWSDDGLRASMRARGHDVGERDGVGVVQLIRRHADRLRAASDPRKGGAPAGY